MATPLLLPALCITLLLSWGSLYYGYTVLAGPMAQSLQASGTAVAAAYSLALLAWGLMSWPMGRALQRWGGRRVMCGGSLLAAAALVLLAHAQSLPVFVAAWALLGLAMAATLYEPAFAVVVACRPGAHRRPIGLLTLAGGLASSVFWPLTQALVQALGWRHTALVFAALQLLVCAPLHAACLPGHAALPRGEAVGVAESGTRPPPLRDARLYWLGAAFAAQGFVIAAMAAVMLDLLRGLGLAAPAALLVAAAIGPMQSAGRLLDLLAGDRLPPQRLGALTFGLLPAGLLLLGIGLPAVAGCVAFVVMYGAGLGLLTLVRASAPLRLFGPGRYALVAGALATPAVLARAAGPLGASALLAALGGDHRVLLLVLAGLSAAGSAAYAMAWRGRAMRPLASAG